MSPCMGFPMSCVHTLLGLVEAIVPLAPARLTSVLGCEDTAATLPKHILSIIEAQQVAKRQRFWGDYSRRQPYSA